MSYTDFDYRGYRYSDLTKSQKTFVDGMIAMHDEVERAGLNVIDADNTLDKIREEIADEVRSEVKEHLASQIRGAIISFGDHNACKAERMPRAKAEKVYGKAFVKEVLG